MGFADLHIHSIYSSDGTSTIPAILKHVSTKTDISVIAITDHDTMEGTKESMDLAPQYGLKAIPGCEISTADGHLLALFIERPIPSGRSLVDSVLMVADQGGVCIAAHPTARGTPSLRFETIFEALWVPCVRSTLVGIEAFNGGLVYTRSNPMVTAMARMLPLAKVGNSDAHVLAMIGHGSTEFEGSSIKNLRRALETGTTTVRYGQGLDGFGVLKTYIPQYILRKMGWAAWNSGPQAPVKYVRLTSLALNNEAA